jgi:preprotein translocase subunit SecY
MNEGEAGRRKITQYTRYGTVALAIFQAIMMTKVLRSIAAGSPQPLIVHDSASWTMMAAMTLATGPS